MTIVTPKSASVKEPQPEPEAPAPISKGYLSAALALLDLTPTEQAIIHHLLWHGRPSWTIPSSDNVAASLTGHVGASADRVKKALVSLHRRGYLRRFREAKGRPVLQLTPKLAEDATVAEHRRRIFGAIAPELWQELGGYTPKMADAIDKAAARLDMRGQTDAWREAALLIVNNKFIEFEAARQRQRNRRGSTRPL